MKIIIDTHIFLWAISANPKLDKNQIQALQTLSNTIYVSSISITELMIKASIGKLNIDFYPISIAKESGFDLLEFSAEDSTALKALPFHHKDPFDRMLISQAMNRKYTIMTVDSKFVAYDCKLFKK
jgi:PIN domain nuclease of toxin-antitoxin system